jgi:hypothetical protein
VKVSDNYKHESDGGLRIINVLINAFQHAHKKSIMIYTKKQLLKGLKNGARITKNIFINEENNTGKIIKMR